MPGGLFARRRMLLISLFAMSAVGVPASWASVLDDTYFSLATTLRYGYGTAVGRAMESSVSLQPRLEVVPRPGIEVVMSGTARADDANRLLPGEPDLASYADASRPATWGSRTVAELDDLYLELQRGRQLLRLGKQQIVWGALDGIKVLDTLNPQSFREFILEDFGDSRIGLWSVYADVSLGATRVELALIPDTTTHYVPESGAWFELTAPRFRFGAPADQGDLPVQVVEHSDVIEHGTAGMRVSRRVGRLDLTAVAVSGIDFEPLGRLAVGPNGPVLERFHERRDVFGISAETAVGPLALRAEAAYLPDRHFNIREGSRLDDEAFDQWRVAAAADVQGPLGLFINLQYVYDQVRDAPDGLVRPQRDHIVTRVPAPDVLL
jgi:hypothetical protein